MGRNDGSNLSAFRGSTRSNHESFENAAYPMAFHIRDAHESDVPALARLHVQTFNETHRGGRSGGPSYELPERQWRESFAVALQSTAGAVGAICGGSSTSVVMLEVGRVSLSESSAPLQFTRFAGGSLSLGQSVAALTDVLVLLLGERQFFPHTRTASMGIING
jgi:hypothetical protein